MPIRQLQLPQTISLAQATAFTRTLSRDRWRTYQIAAGFDDDLAHRLYLWNAALGQSFHFPLQSVEVALRNVVHLALTAEYGEDWPGDATLRSVIGTHQLADIEKAERRHLRKYGSQPSKPQLVASLSLGFWVTILRARTLDASLWAHQLTAAFPGLKDPETVISLGTVGARIQDLRNRIFHQEPLIGQDLTRDYGAILKMLGWICPETRDWTRKFSSVPRVLRERPR